MRCVSVCVCQSPLPNHRSGRLQLDDASRFLASCASVSSHAFSLASSSGALSRIEYGVSFHHPFMRVRRRRRSLRSTTCNTFPRRQVAQALSCYRLCASHKRNLGCAAGCGAITASSAEQPPATCNFCDCVASPAEGISHHKPSPSLCSAACRIRRAGLWGRSTRSR